jgi:hypothetical protein
MKGSRQKLNSIIASCPICEKVNDAKNAQAWAHQHARRTGHVVYFSAEYRVTPFRQPSMFDAFEKARDTA